MPPERRTGPSYMRGGVVACPKKRHASPRCAPLTDGAAAGTWRGETNASVLHRVDLAVVLARMLLPGVPMGRTNTTGWRGPLVKARPWEVKGLDLVVNRSRVRRDGGPGCSNVTGGSYRALIHAGWCCGMSEEAARVSGAWPPSRTAPPPAPRGGKLPRRFYTEWMYLLFWPGCCSRVSLWADLTQPGGEVHWSKPVRGKSKG